MRPSKLKTLLPQSLFRDMEAKANPQTQLSVPTDLSGTTLYGIPVEVMRRIFDFCIEEPRPATPPALSVSSVLCSVCTTWRNIATNHPPLWSNIVIRATRRDTIPSNEWKMQCRREYAVSLYRISSAQATYLTTRLARMGAFPMSLRINFFTASLWGPDDENFWSQAIPLCTFLKDQNLTNLRLFHISGYQAKAELGHLCLPNLETLIMEDIDPTTMEIGNPICLPSIPSLRRFACKDVPIDLLPPTFPWSQLTHIHLETGHTFEELRTIFLAASRLERACIRARERHMPFTALPSQQLEEGDITATNNLRRLTLTEDGRYTPYQWELLTVLPWPILTHLRVSPGGNSTWNPQNLRHMVSLTHLSLSLGGSNVTLISATLVLHSCPLLVQLVLDINGPVDHAILFRALSFDPHKPRLPHLEELGITCVIRPGKCPWWYTTRDGSDAFTALHHLITSRTPHHVTTATPASLKRLGLVLSRGREYNAIAKEVEGILRSSFERLDNWRLIRGAGGTDPTFFGTFDSWEGGHLEALAALLG